MLAELGHWTPLWYSSNGHDYACLSSSATANELTKENEPTLGTWFRPTLGMPSTAPSSGANAELDGMIIIDQLTLTSQAKQLLSKGEFSELTSAQVSTLNKDWQLYPQLRFYASQLFAGAIMIDNGRAILINTVEPYSRDSSLDAHFERRLPGMPSSYPDARGKYGHFTTVLMQSDGVKKLVVGTRTCNLLVTSSIRLDIASVNIGPGTSHFKPSENTRVFLDAESVELANENMMNERTIQAQDMLSMFQLKQVRSKFDSLSTYTMCRASSRLSSPLELQPATIWTLCEDDSAQTKKSQEKIASSFFQLIAQKVIVRGHNASLELQEAEAIFAQAKDTAIGRTLSHIKQLFVQEPSITIIGNANLNSLLFNLASTMTSALRAANKSKMEQMKARAYV
ncbi:uncharacterized protein BYT42DRAFT_414614 [Radiomyces spectabilis]|uniref:uncharacterized protein n=1 Tax=Radiomyces spectabilis TaxID=64574 RepID=UPI002220C47E|nr:uncharacterized protein BYT42DRAFT_414614 [Radiomyces spectabilis]KAI8374646.1 hypothetical protein BYT42DRAFT_414614 [Radiomyces spectabilis]